MARAPNPNYSKAQDLYKKGRNTNEIAKQLNIPAGTVRRWKVEWDGGKDNERSQKITSAHNVQKEQIKKQLDSVDSNNELTEKQRLFCLYYVKTFNATGAYQKAYHCSYDTANSDGPANLVKPCIQNEIKRLKDLKRTSLLMDGTDVVEKYMQIAFADITDYISFGQTETEYGKKNMIHFKESSEVDGTLISEIKQGKDGASVKLPDRLKALEWLSKYFELNPMDNHRVEFGKRKLELEIIKANDGTALHEENEVKDSDGFLEALEEQAGAIWTGGEAE